MRRDLPGLQRLFRLGPRDGKRRQDTFNRHKTIARFRGDFLRLVERTCRCLIHIGLARVAAHFGVLFNGRIDRAAHSGDIPASAGDQIGCKAFAVIQKSLQKMFGFEGLVPLPHRNRLRGLKEPARTFGELLHVHTVSPYIAPRFFRRPLGSTSKGQGLSQ